jgi:hypothetical protein
MWMYKDACLMNNFFKNSNSSVVAAFLTGKVSKRQSCSKVPVGGDGGANDGMRVWLVVQERDNLSAERAANSVLSTTLLSFKFKINITPYKQPRKSRQAVQQQHRKGSHGSRNQTDESLGESELSRKQLSKNPTRFVLGV